MTDPKTKTVLGRVFTWRRHFFNVHSCDLKNGQVLALFVWPGTYDQHQIALGTHGVTSKEALAIAKMEAQMARLTRKQCAGILNYAQGYLDGRGYASEYPGLLGNLSAALFAASEEVTVVGWQVEQIRIAAMASASLGASDIADALRHVATTLEAPNA